MATGTASELKNRYKNNTSGWLGVVLKNAKGDLHGISVPPGDEVWMDEAERVATAQAPREAKNNPFSNGALVKTAEAGEAKTNREIDAPLVPDAEPAQPAPPPPGAGMPREERPPDPDTPPPAAPAPGEEATDTPLAASAPPTGQRAPGEEVGSPDAERAAADSAKGEFREKDDGSKPAEAAEPPPAAPGSEPTVSSAPPGGTQEAARQPVARQGQGGR